MTRAAVYVRISQDRGGAGLGVTRQEQDCRALLERRGWTHAETFVDNDVSAYSGKVRPAWQRLVQGITAGKFDALAVYHVDRLTRSPRELEDVIDLADRHGLDLATVTGDVDLGTPTGRMVARMLGAAARHEGEHKAERQRRERRASAEAGKVAGGGNRPFGYEADRFTIREDEAEVIREAARRVLAGETLSSVCRDFLARDIQTPSGGHWQPRTLRRLLASARVSGRREHTPTNSFVGGTRPLLGEIVADAVWPAIITTEDSDRLRTLLSSPARRTHEGTGRTYLLSGILRCGRCGTGLCGRPRGKVPRYVCPNVPGGKSCGGVATNAKRTDDFVRDLVLTALANPTIRDHLGPDDQGPRFGAEIARIEAQLEELAVAWAAEDISRNEWKAAKTVLDGRADDLRRRMLKDRRSILLAGVDLSGDLRAMWDGLATDAQRRELVGSVIESINVGPADPRRRWDESRFGEPKWRI